jgi:tetratricopeptide (TPR) repeat protein
MLAIKNLPCPGAMALLALTVFVAGCAPSGPRALLKGKKLLEQGDYPGAVAQLKVATSLLVTNAQAWNYLGVACQHAGQTATAVLAYQRAFALDRDLVEAHYNLGCLWLEQNKPDAARGEFTACTLRRSRAPEGWLKLGLAQLRLHDLTSAEKSFSTALYLHPNDAEALNGLGLARVERGRAREAAQFFAAAVRAHPDYAPALLNLATVAQEHLHDNALALKNYRAYLALTPRPANWDAVNDLASSLEPPTTVAATLRPPGQNPAGVAAAPTGAESKPPLPQAAGAARAPTPTKTEPGARGNLNPPRATSFPREIVKVQPAPVLAPTPTRPGETPTEPTTAKPGIWHQLNPFNWFGSVPKNAKEMVTPLPPSASSAPGNPPLLLPTKPEVTTAAQPVNPPASAPKPVNIVQPAPPPFPRYLYLSPPKPKSGDRRAASGAFTRAREFEQDGRWLDAGQAYQQAARLDPGWFEAQYNCGVVAFRLRNFNQSLAAYEMALALQPDSVDARYNFALALKASGYMLDAVNELQEIVAANPNEARAHLALGNLYAQQLRDLARARAHYLKVLELDPRNPEATNIRFWLSANPA